MNAMNNNPTLNVLKHLDVDQGEFGFYKIFTVVHR